MLQLFLYFPDGHAHALLMFIALVKVIHQGQAEKYQPHHQTQPRHGLPEHPGPQSRRLINQDHEPVQVAADQEKGRRSDNNHFDYSLDQLKQGPAGEYSLQPLHRVKPVQLGRNMSAGKDKTHLGQIGNQPDPQGHHKNRPGNAQKVPVSQRSHPALV